MPNIMQWVETQMNVFFLHPYTAFPFFFLLFFLYKFLFRKHPTRKHLPPSPPKLPIIGNLHQIDELPHRSLHNLSKKHGELMLLHFGRNPILIVTSAEAASEVMKTHDMLFSDRPALAMFKRLLYDCKDIATAPYGDYWRRMRSICVLQLLSYKRVQSFHNIREEEITQMIDGITRSQAAVNLSKVLANYTSDVICRVAFGMKFNGERNGINFKELMEKHEELVGRINVGDFIPWLAWLNHVTGVEREINKVFRDMNRFLEEIVQEHLGKLSKTQSIHQQINEEKTQDLVDVLLELQQDQSAEESINKESIKAIILDMFVAGSTTTYTTMQWAMSELLQNPRAMESLKKEVREVNKDNTIISENDLEKMEYLKAVIKETLRLHPPLALLLPRISTREAKINGYCIPARTQVIINAWAIHRNPTFWKEPEQFSPERFLNSPIDFKGQHFNLIPFGSGRRGCPGIFFAMANIELALANLIRKFDWALPEGKTLDMMENPGLTAHRKNPLLLVATPHST